MTSNEFTTSNFDTVRAPPRIYRNDGSRQERPSAHRDATVVVMLTLAAITAAIVALLGV
ncbi:MAG: hypothetical protein NW205_05760 [Hyphomicrobiaceae bacterium]|nr:hypothetical protein [Hyphomicrobiaceae bacterium]